MPIVRFPYDNDCSVIVPDGWYSYDYSTRPFKEPYFRSVINGLIQTGKIRGNIVEGGAFLGDNAVPWAKNRHDTVYAIDPSAGNCDYMRELIRLNNLTNVHVFQNALSDREEILSTSDDLYMCSFVKNTGTNKATAVSLDSLYAQGKIQSIGFIHLDVEGFEHKTILGAERVLRDFMPVIAYEQHLDTDDYRALAEHLKSRGYRVHILDEILEGCRPDCRNFLATSFELDPSLKTIRL